ncbi:MAG TPA: sulfur carrier protein ThiS [Desulfobacteraceae bacterium]|jgi:thiamine biosynthesis protein ThiS|nr:sulfur carrier protein ThiS [Desulfobacteraceae bacterium]
MTIQVQGKKIPWKEGMTVSDLLDELDDPYPYAVVRIDGKIVCRPDFDTTQVPDGSQIFLISMVAGG